MSEPVLPSPWSRLRWATTIAVVMALQVLLIVFFSGQKQPSPKETEKNVRYTLLNGSNRSLAEEMPLMTVRDPSLLGLPHRKGASGSAWLNPEPLRHALYEWSPEPAWLEASSERLAGAFNELMARHEPPRRSMAKKPAPEFRSTFPTRSVLAQESRLLMKGGLADRSLVTSSELSSIPSEALVSNSVVRVVVDAQGRPLSTHLVSSSGSGTADRKAMEHAKRARFKPLADVDPWDPSDAPGDNLTWGRLEYQWHTVTPEPDEPGGGVLKTNGPAL